jgi:hypothetical protein
MKFFIFNFLKCNRKELPNFAITHFRLKFQRIKTVLLHEEFFKLDKPPKQLEKSEGLRKYLIE